MYWFEFLLLLGLAFIALLRALADDLRGGTTSLPQLSELQIFEQIVVAGPD